MKLRGGANHLPLSCHSLQAGGAKHFYAVVMPILLDVVSQSEKSL